MLVLHAAPLRQLRLPVQHSTLHASAASANGGGSSNGDGGSQHRAAQQQQQRATKPHCIPNLRGEEFQHPLDAQSTALLRMLPGLEMVARGVLSPAAEQILTLENIGSSVLVGPQQLPSLHMLLQEAADILGVQMPELYVRQNPIPNA